MPLETERERRQQEEILRLLGCVTALQAANAELHDQAEIWRMRFEGVCVAATPPRKRMRPYVEAVYSAVFGADAARRAG